MRRRALPPVLLAAALLSACASVPPSPHAQVQPPPAWRAAVPAGSVVEPGWWQAFGDPRLAAAVERALAGNVDLAVAEAGVREAEALSRQARSGLWPTLDAVASAERARTLGDTGRTAIGETRVIQAQVSYEVDLWGRVRSANTAARASLQASRYGRDAAALSVAAATAGAYIQLLSLDAQLQTARETLASRDHALRIAAQRARAGYTSQLELSQAQAEQRSAAQAVPALELAVRQQENALRLLTGDAPGAVARGRFDALQLPVPEPGLPSALLARRPDVAEAEEQLAAADATWASNRAALLPQLALTGSAGRLLVEPLDPVSVWNLGASLLAPLFDGGRRAAVADAAQAQRDQAAWAYRGVVLGALAETEDALEGIVRLQTQAVELEARRAAVADSLRHARNRYRAGYASYLEELDAQRSLYGADQERIQLREQRLLNAVALYQALGGGWAAAGE